jgi:hypothetical protein
VRERRDSVFLFAADMEGLAARDEEIETPARSKQTGDVSCRLGDVLEVVEHEEHLSVAYVLGETVACLQHPADRLEHELGVPQWSEWDPPHTVRITVSHGRGGLRRETRLAGAAGTGERKQADAWLRLEVKHVAQFLRAAKERRRRNRQVRLVQALQRWEVVLAELVDAFRRREVLQAVVAEVTQAFGADESRGGCGDDDLPAVRRGGDPRRPVNVGADVAFGDEMRRPGVDAHANADLSACEVFLRVLRLCRRGNRCLRCSKRDEEPVTLGVHFHTTVASEGLAQGSSVLGKCLGVRIGPERPQQVRRALDVREEECHGPCRKVTPHHRLAQVRRPDSAPPARSSTNPAVERWRPRPWRH